MIIGLLEAECLPESVASRFGSYGDMFETLLQPIDEQLQFRRYAVEEGELPASIRECDAYVLTGSRHNAYDRDPWIENLKDLIRQLHAREIKCLGICFGHQVIAEALGGKVEKSPRGWGVGLATFHTCAQPDWMRQTQAQFNIRVSHQDQVSRLPAQAVLFATSEFCPNGGYFIGNHLFCLQGHPEFSEEYVQFLIDKREERIGATRVREARESLKQAVSIDLLRNWLGDFFA